MRNAVHEAGVGRIQLRHVREVARLRDVALVGCARRRLFGALAHGARFVADSPEGVVAVGGEAPIRRQEVGGGGVAVEAHADELSRPIGGAQRVRARVDARVVGELRDALLPQGESRLALRQYDAQLPPPRAAPAAVEQQDGNSRLRRWRLDVIRRCDVVGRRDVSVVGDQRDVSEAAAHDQLRAATAEEQFDPRHVRRLHSARRSVPLGAARLRSVPLGAARLRSGALGGLHGGGGSDRQPVGGRSPLPAGRRAVPEGLRVQAAPLVRVVLDGDGLHGADRVLAVALRLRQAVDRLVGLHQRLYVAAETGVHRVAVGGVGVDERATARLRPLRLERRRRRRCRRPSRRRRVVVASPRRRAEDV